MILSRIDLIGDEPPAVSENTRPTPTIDTTGSYSVKTEELYAENEGQQIYGLLYLPVEAESPRPVVIYAHGFGGSYRNGDQYAQALSCSALPLFWWMTPESGSTALMRCRNPTAICL